MSDRDKIIDTLKTCTHFYLISHLLPDGDSVGSLLAMGRSLEKAGKKISMFTPGHIPLKYRFMSGSEKVKSSVCGFEDRSVPVLVLDCSDADRLGLFKEIVMNSDLIINIDHHVTNQNFGTFNLIDPEASATGEIIFGLFEELGSEIDCEIAEALYVAIATDTGSFKYDNTTASTHIAIAKLLQFGISPGALAQKIFDERPLSFYILLKEALAGLEFYMDRRVAVMSISKDIRIRSGATTDDLDGIINYTRNIEGVELGILFYVEGGHEVKIGFRSKQLDVSVLAGKLNGGGHIRAAGCRLYGNYETIKAKVLAAAFTMMGEQDL